MHLNSEFRNTCYRLKLRKFPPFQLKYTCDLKSLTMRKHSEFVSTCWEGRINTQLPEPPQATSKDQNATGHFQTYDKCVPFQHTDRKCGRIMRAREKREESHTDYKGIPILVVKKEDRDVTM